MGPRNLPRGLKCSSPIGRSRITNMEAVERSARTLPVDNMHDSLVIDGDFRCVRVSLCLLYDRGLTTRPTFISRLSDPDIGAILFANCPRQVDGIVGSNRKGRSTRRLGLTSANHTHRFLEHLST